MIYTRSFKVIYEDAKFSFGFFTYDCNNYLVLILLSASALFSKT